MPRTTVITGVSRGLGEALFQQLYARGDRVVALGRRFTAEQHDLAETDPAQVVLLEVDLARPESLPGPARLAELLAGADQVALVHNAAMVAPIGAIGALPPTELVAAVTVNLTAPALLTNAFLAARPDHAAANLLFLSSGAAHRVINGWAVYGATKRGGESFFEALAAQVADYPRIRVAAVNPGVMDTGMQQEIRTAAAGDNWFPDRDRFVQLHERGELADPATVAGELISNHLPTG